MTDVGRLSVTMLKSVRLCLLVAAFAAGCGNSAGPSGANGGANGSGGSSGDAGTTATGGSGAQATAGAAGSGTVGVGVATGTRVFTGTAAMLFDGPSCTAEPGAVGDRWCGFLALSLDNTWNLFVVNVSQVIAGVAVECGEPDPNCLLLTPALRGDSLDPTLHGTFFQGDTLVYYDESLVPYAWRPGMSAGRMLASVSAAVDVILCTPATRGTAVACLALPSTQEDANLARAELLAGKADGEDEPLLAAIDDVIAANAADLGGTARFGYGYPPIAGDYIAWTSRETADGPEILKLQKVDDPESQVAVASDVHGWDVSPDGSHWFWLSAIDSNGVGSLQTAPFPAGASPTEVQAGVVEYGLSSADGSAVVTRTPLGDLTAIADPALFPESQIVIDSNVQSLLSFSGNGRVAYAKHFVGTNLIDLFVSKVDGTGACAVDTTTSVPLRSVHFSPDAEAAVWARSKAGGFDGLHTRLSDCSTTSLAPDVAALGWLGHETVLFIDDYDVDAGTGSIRLRTIVAEDVLEPQTPRLIANEVDSYAILAPTPGALVYTVNGGADANGVYVHGLEP